MLILGVVKLVPVPKELPPLELTYQFKVPPAQGVADKLTVPVPQREFGVPVGAGGIAFTITVTVVVLVQVPAVAVIVNVVVC